MNCLTSKLQLCLIWFGVLVWMSITQKYAMIANRMASSINAIP